MSEPFCVRVEAFSTSQVVLLLQNVPEEGKIEIPPAKPKACEVYNYIRPRIYERYAGYTC